MGLCKNGLNSLLLCCSFSLGWLLLMLFTITSCPQPQRIDTEWIFMLLWVHHQKANCKWMGSPTECESLLCKNVQWQNQILLFQIREMSPCSERWTFHYAQYWPSKLQNLIRSIVTKGLWLEGKVKLMNNFIAIIGAVKDHRSFNAHPHLNGGLIVRREREPRSLTKMT